MPPIDFNELVEAEIERVARQFERVEERYEQQLEKLRKELDQANGLWRYWTLHDITESDEHWADFSNAVRDHLDGKGVPTRFLEPRKR